MKPAYFGIAAFGFSSYGYVYEESSQGASFGLKTTQGSSNVPLLMVVNREESIELHTSVAPSPSLVTTTSQPLVFSRSYTP